VEKAEPPLTVAVPVGSDGALTVSLAFLRTVEPSLDDASAQLTELQQHQTALLKDLVAQSASLSEAPDLQAVIAQMAQVPAYQAKLVALQKQMASIGARAAKVRAKAAQLNVALADKKAAATAAQKIEHERDTTVLRAQAAAGVEEVEVAAAQVREKEKEAATAEESSKPSSSKSSKKSKKKKKKAT
jgi:hypothetical protein|tara:strand:- start:111 stop:671 length:561 start_codon:yes stop_codon:yes gene_type:complete